MLSTHPWRTSRSGINQTHEGAARRAAEFGLNRTGQPVPMGRDPACRVVMILKGLVGGTGIEPVTPSMSTKCSPAELTARDPGMESRIIPAVTPRNPYGGVEKDVQDRGRASRVRPWTCAHPFG